MDKNKKTSSKSTDRNKKKGNYNNFDEKEDEKKIETNQSSDKYKRKTNIENTKNSRVNNIQSNIQPNNQAINIQSYNESINESNLHNPQSQPNQQSEEIQESQHYSQPNQHNQHSQSEHLFGSLNRSYSQEFIYEFEEKLEIKTHQVVIRKPKHIPVVVPQPKRNNLITIYLFINLFYFLAATPIVILTPTPIKKIKQNKGIITRDTKILNYNSAEKKTLTLPIKPISLNFKEIVNDTKNTYYFKDEFKTKIKKTSNKNIITDDSKLAESYSVAKESNIIPEIKLLNILEQKAENLTQIIDHRIKPQNTLKEIELVDAPIQNIKPNKINEVYLKPHNKNCKICNLSMIL